MKWWFWIVSAPVLVQIPRPFSFERRTQSGLNAARYTAAVFGRQFDAEGSEGEKREDLSYRSGSRLRGWHERGKPYLYDVKRDQGSPSDFASSGKCLS